MFTVRTLWNTQIHSVGRTRIFSMLTQVVHIQPLGFINIFTPYSPKTHLTLTSCLCFFLASILYEFLVSLMPDTWPVHHILLDLLILILYDESTFSFTFSKTPSGHDWTHNRQLRDMARPFITRNYLRTLLITVIIVWYYCNIYMILTANSMFCILGICFETTTNNYDNNRIQDLVRQITLRSELRNSWQTAGIMLSLLCNRDKLFKPPDHYTIHLW
jgi:hypothetical protein